MNIWDGSPDLFYSQGEPFQVYRNSPTPNITTLRGRYTKGSKHVRC